jgi:altronate hydrolase
METPGFDPPLGDRPGRQWCDVVCFTTGRGSVLGTKPVPSIKIAFNTAMFERLRDDMDLDAGGIAEGHTTIDAIGELIFETALAVASAGRRSARISTWAATSSSRGSWGR